jgi:acyl-coenzyme A thioesterase PaaI-like protein
LSLPEEAHMIPKLAPGEIRSFVEKPFDFVARCGLRALELAPRRVRLGMPLAGNTNHFGAMYAGALFTVAEIPGGALFLTTFDVTRFYPVIKEMTIRFRRPAFSDVTVEVELAPEEAARIAAEAEARGKAEFVLEGAVRDGDGTVVAETRGVYQIRRLES